MDIRDAIKANNTAIEAIDLVKDYGSGSNAVHALRDVNIAFEQGKFTVIMGPSGSGKSTLMHTLAGLDSATSGHVMFDGKDLTRMNDDQLTLLRRHQIGFIFQSPFRSCHSLIDRGDSLWACKRDCPCMER